MCIERIAVEAVVFVPKHRVSPNGTTAITTSAGKNEMIGARLWRSRSAFGGMKSSFQMVFKPVGRRVQAGRRGAGRSGLRRSVEWPQAA